LDEPTEFMAVTQYGLTEKAIDLQMNKLEETVLYGQTLHTHNAIGVCTLGGTLGGVRVLGIPKDKAWEFANTKKEPLAYSQKPYSPTLNH